MKFSWPLFAVLLILTGCAGNPIDVEPVSNFEVEPYLGTWYEVARLDHGFERGLSHVSATYTQREDGKITVLNKGYKLASRKFKDAEGLAEFKNDKSVGHLKVSFFGPFYGDYIIFKLGSDSNRHDPNGHDAYSHAYVSGGRDSYLWLLSRTPEIPDNIRQDFLESSRALGYDLEKLIWVDHTSEIKSAG